MCFNSRCRFLYRKYRISSMYNMTGPTSLIDLFLAHSSVSVENNTRQSTSGDSTSQYSVQPSNQIQASIFKSDSNVDVSATMARGMLKQNNINKKYWYLQYHQPSIEEKKFRQLRRRGAIPFIEVSSLSSSQN